MVELPDKDTIEAVEIRLGKRPVRIVLWLVLIAAGIGALGVILAAFRSAFASLRPFVPAPTMVWADWAYRAFLIAANLAGLLWVTRQLRRLQRSAADHERLNDVVNAEAEAAAKAEEKFKRLEGRFDYIEKKIGSELQDLLTERILEEKGIPLDQIKRVVQILPVPGPITHAEETRLAHARDLLREAAQMARNVPAGFRSRHRYQARLVEPTNGSLH